ncbi:MAG TPA: hypothetical protein VKR31_09460 [Rhizomicrobium sp.]|nr:hypothetical protein [Rhizomicrobium sp.]
MTTTKIAVLVTLLSATGAFAAEPPMTTESDCHDMAKQVKTALADHAQSPNYHNAVVQERYGRQFCTSGFEHDGVVHYARALELLQSNKT